MQRKRAVPCSRVAPGRLACGSSLAAFIILGGVGAGCSSDSSARSEDTGAEPAQPYSGAEGGQGPRATETNFFTVPCDDDADCAAPLRCVRPDSGLPKCE